MSLSDYLTLPDVVFFSRRDVSFDCRSSSVSSLKQRRCVIIKGNVLDKISALLSSYIVIFACSGT
jgi:hypothetical protein